MLRAALALLNEAFVGRVIPFGSDAASCYATIAAERQRRGQPISHCDAQIAAIAKSAESGSWTPGADSYCAASGCSQLLLGNDATGATPFVGRMESLGIYAVPLTDVEVMLGM